MACTRCGASSRVVATPSGFRPGTSKSAGSKAESSAKKPSSVKDSIKGLRYVPGK